MKNLTMNQIKAIIIRPEVFSLVGSYLLARAHAEIMREEVDKIERAVLEAFPIYSTPLRNEESKRLYLGRELYLSRDEELCNTAYDLFDTAERKAGLKPSDMPTTHCPALVAGSLLVDVENALLDEVCPKMGVDVGLVYGDNRSKMIDLIVGAVVAHPQFEKPEVK